MIVFLNAAAQPLATAGTGQPVRDHESVQYAKGDQPNPVGENAHTQGKTIAGQRRSVLVVDDEPTVRLLITEVLDDLNYQSLEAIDGPSGLQILRSGMQIDLLITDVGLPGGMDGRHLASAARAERPGLAILFITGYTETAVLGDGTLEPGTMVLTKPFSIDTLTLYIQELTR